MELLKADTMAHHRKKCTRTSRRITGLFLATSLSVSESFPCHEFPCSQRRIRVVKQSSDKTSLPGFGRTQCVLSTDVMFSETSRISEHSDTDKVNDIGNDNIPFLFPTDPNDNRYSASDWWQNILSLPRSTILHAIKGPVLTVFAWSFAITVLHRCLIFFGWITAAARMYIPPQPHSFLVSALGLLLVFRTNSAYQRFAEGRKIWESILSLSRNVSRMSILYESEFGVARRRRVFRLLAAFPYLLHYHIQPQKDSRCIQNTEYGLPLQRKGSTQQQPEQPSPHRQRRMQTKTAFLAETIFEQKLPADKGPPKRASHRDHQNNTDDRSNLWWVDRRVVPWCLLPNSALRQCVYSANRPLWICDRLSQEINEVAYTPNFTSRERLTFLSNIDKLPQCIGACERIHQTAVPLNYARHSLRSLTLWLFTLPFALIKDFGLLTAPVMGLASWLLYGIYQIGYTIEDPFQGSLRLTTLCDAIYRDVMYGTDAMQRRETAFVPSEREREEWLLLDEPSLAPPSPNHAGSSNWAILNTPGP